MRFHFICIASILFYWPLILAQENFILEDSICISGDYLDQITIQNTSQNVLKIDSIRILNHESIASPYDTMTLIFSTDTFGHFIYDIFGNRDSNNNRITILPGRSRDFALRPSIFPKNQSIYLICVFFAGESLDTLHFLIIPGMAVRFSPHEKNWRFERNASEANFDAVGRKTENAIRASGILLSPGSSIQKKLNLSRQKIK